ncbi:MAG: hypothetical protein R3315_00415, partial [Woeseiaceae bacterium]|nr:hypothetical protein [Woeseiaceae bacterium]
GRIVREASAGIDRLGLVLRPRPREGFVHYRDAELPASRELLGALLVPNATTLVDIRLRRIVHANVFALDEHDGGTARGSFKRTKPGEDILD